MSSCTALSLLATTAIWASPAGETTPSVYGMPGVIEMPSARVYPDAELVLTFGGFPGQLRNTLTFQITPRLTGSFRYSRIEDFQPGDRTLYDRSFDIAFQVLTETATRPSVSIGLRDFIGTGIYGGEYVVASKTFGDRVTVTGGLGWGRLGSYGGLGAPFGERPALDFGLGGKLTTDQWFRGDVAPFAGIEWQATNRLTVMAEYSSDGYDEEVSRGLMDRTSPLNLGLAWRFENGTVVQGYWLHGEEVGASVSFALNPKRAPLPTGIEPAPLPVLTRPAPAADPEAWATDWVADPGVEQGIEAALSDALAKEGIELLAMSLGARVAAVTIQNTRFNAHPEAVGRTARIMSRAMPASVSRFDITLAPQSGLPASTMRIARSDLERLEFSDPGVLFARTEFTDAAGVPAPAPENRFEWSIEPYLTLSAFDPDNPLGVNAGVRATGRMELGRGFVLSGSVKKPIGGNLDEVDDPSPTGLPRVRSSIGRYNAEGDPALEYLTLEHYGRPATNLYSKVSAGYLETMFGGVAGELLWKPVDSRLALGAEVAGVRQREFEQLFGFQDYETVTGHVSAYYEFDGGFIGQVDVGRYLAGDVGATLSLSRTFGNGWSVGAFVTRTDATFEDFGEGSFDKGIRMTIPLESLRATPSRDRAELGLRSLSRDGGARLNLRDRLYGQVREAHRDEMGDRWGRFWR